MNEENIILVKNSFAMVAPRAEAVAALFYERLFQLDPALKPLFRHPIDEQGRKLILALTFAVNNLANPQELLPALKDLGRRHRGYGVRDEYYDTVGSALLWTLEQGLGAAFTVECRAAWTEAYGLVATVMKS